MSRLPPSIAALLVLATAAPPALAELPTPLSRFSSLPCLAPIIRAVDPEAPENIGEALLLPPYRKLSPPAGVGLASFPLTGVPAETQTAFDRGLALLHGFDDTGAERCFREAASATPEHPMPYWGMALANERSPGRAAVYIGYADHLAGTMPDLSARERGWVHTYMRYFVDEPNTTLSDTEKRRARVAALEDLAYDHPDDAEARAFLLRELVLDAHRAGIAVGSRYAVDALAASLLEAHPKHPAASYRALLWLDARPERAARFAAAAPARTPASPGAWRTAAEAFAAAGDFGSASRAGDAAARLDLAHMAADMAMPDERPPAIAGIAAHVETLIACGANAAAADLARHLIALPRTAHRAPGRGALAQAKQGAFMTGRRLLASALMRAGRWAELRDACTVGALSPAEAWADRAHTLYWRAIAEWHLGQSDVAAATGTELEQLFRLSLSEGTTLDAETEITETIKSLRAYAALFEKEAPPPSARQPLHIAAPQLARLHAERGSRDAALEISAKHLRDHPTQPEAVATHCALLAGGGATDAALPLFDTAFRRSASLADPGHIAFGEALAPVVARLGLRGNWTLPSPGWPGAELPPGDVSLLGRGGRWAPPAAPVFELAQPGGNTLSLASLRGRPAVVIFFVGVHCAFCVEQLKIFQPHAAAFTEAGIPIHTVSTDSAATLETTLAAAAEDDPAAPAFPFPIASDESLATFRDYRCFDHFNEKALHGIYLISPDGRILWNHISHEPFLYPDFLLREATRLLQLWPRTTP